MRRSPKTAYSVCCAHLCLIATLLLYAPLAGVAWHAASMNCCEGDYCPIHHHERNKASTHDANCSHEGNAKAGCAMDCCHTPEKATLTSLSFVLPDVEIATRLDFIAPATEAGQSNGIRVFLDPLSPPPRPAASIL
jgi:hypothetical protein